MIDKYNGDSCKNARIKIDYRGLKPNVKFSYPDKKNQQNYSMFPTILFFWGMALLIIYGGYSIFFIEDSSEVVDFSNYSICNSYYINESVGCRAYYINKSIETCELREGKTDVDILISSLKENFDKKSLFLLLFIFLPPILIYFPFKRYWANVFPKFQAGGISGKLVIFKPKDIRKKEEDYYFVEIPLFRNVMLDYDAKKDFSKYLSYFEIREYNFKYIKGKTMEKAMKSKKEVNEDLWYARFYFSKKPVEGELRVLFK